MKHIESRNNPTIKWAATLTAKKGREAEGLFCFEGVHLLEEYIRSGNFPKMLFVREDALNKYCDLINSAGCEVFSVTSSVYEKLTEEKAPQGIFTVAERLNNIKPLIQETVKELKGTSIALADLQDNGNVGTVIRTAAALDCNIILCGNCADIYSPKTVRATMGAMFFANVYVADTALDCVTLLQKQGKRVIATALTDKAQTLGRFDINNDDCFMVGNEGKGLKEDVIAQCDLTAIIPMSGKTESLNAATAAAVILWEAKRGKM